MRRSTTTASSARRTSFNLVIQRLGRPGSQLVDDQELFESLSMDPTDERFVVDALHESELVRLVGPLPLTRPDADAPGAPGRADSVSSRRAARAPTAKSSRTTT